MRVKKFLLSLILILILIFSFTSSSFAILRYGRIPGRSGLSFSNINYHHSNLTFDVSNKNHRNITLGGTMLFVDRHNKVVARAEILPQKIKRRGSRKFKAVFTEGSGADAKSAKSLIWNLD